jgi:hypothetical protein
MNNIIKKQIHSRQISRPKYTTVDDAVFLQPTYTQTVINVSIVCIGGLQ